MQLVIGQCTLELTMGDITTQKVDAIVNAANAHLAGGGGVDGAIHRHGGPAIMEETGRRYPKGCPTGSAVISGGGLLSAKFVIHAVGPIWQGGKKNEEALLKSAYVRSLELAVEHQLNSIALPALSTGAYGYPMDLASRHSLQSCGEFLRSKNSPTLLRFVLFGEGAYGAFAAALDELSGLWKITQP